MPPPPPPPSSSSSLSTPVFSSPLEELLYKRKRVEAVDVDDTTPEYVKGVEKSRKKYKEDHPVYDYNPLGIKEAERRVAPSLKTATSIADALKDNEFFQRMRKKAGDSDEISGKVQKEERKIGRIDKKNDPRFAALEKIYKGSGCRRKNSRRTRGGSAAMRAKMAYVRSFRKKF